VSEFFEPPPPQPEPEPFRPPPWHGPPSNVLGGFVPIRLLLARTEHGLLSADGLNAYPTGFAFALVVQARPSEDDRLLDWDPFSPPRRRGIQRRDPRSPGIAPEVLRFGIQFSDGSKATNLRPPQPTPNESPTGPVLICHGGGGGGTEWRLSYWTWPLPPPGPLTFVCEWPARGIPLSRVEMDAGLILDAAKEAEVLWPDETPEEGASGFGYVSTALSRTEMPRPSSTSRRRAAGETRGSAQHKKGS